MLSKARIYVRVMISDWMVTYIWDFLDLNSLALQFSFYRVIFFMSD